MLASEQPIRLKHVGVDSFFAERAKLLGDYDKAKRQTVDDSVKTDHGDIGEILARRWLETFLPKRFGVCKGHIITTNLGFRGPLEDWDVLIYDALESPVLFTRGVMDSGATERRAIPIEHVRAVLEVKATLTPANAKKCSDKLLKIQQHIGQNQSANYPEYLCRPFGSAVVFFETKVESFAEYRRALDELTVLYQHNIRFMGGLVLRSARNPEHAGYLNALVGEKAFLEDEIWEMSSPFNLANGQVGQFGTMGWGYNNYPTFLFDLLAELPRYAKSHGFKFLWLEL